MATLMTVWMWQTVTGSGPTRYLGICEHTVNKIIRAPSLLQLQIEQIKNYECN